MLDDLMSKVPDPEDLGPAVIGRGQVPAVGWRDGDKLYLFTTEPGPTDHYHVVIVRPPLPQLVTYFATRAEAERKARELYWQEALGSRPETFAELATTMSRFDYWRLRKQALGNGELHEQVTHLMNEIIPLRDLQPYRLQAETPQPGQPFAVQVLVGKNYERAISGVDLSPNIAIARFLVDFEQWVARNRT